MRGEDCRQAKNFKKSFSSSFSLLRSCLLSVHSPIIAQLIPLFGVSLWPIHPSSSSLVQSWPCTKRHFWFGSEALSFPSTNRELIGWVRHTGNDEDASKKKKKKSEFLFTKFLFFRNSFQPTPFTADTKQKNVERKSIYVTWQVSELLPPPFSHFVKIFFFTVSTVNSLRLTDWICYFY